VATGSKGKGKERERDMSEEADLEKRRLAIKDEKRSVRWRIKVLEDVLEGLQVQEAELE
jgi:hypothetical protein